MNKSSKKIMTEKHRKKLEEEYSELIDMIESGMEDYEIANELGIEVKHVSDLKRKIYKDMV